MNRVREFRRSKGWSLARLARESFVSKSHLSSIERGKKEPTISVARRIAGALGSNLDQVFPALPADGGRSESVAAAGDQKSGEAPSKL